MTSNDNAQKVDYWNVVNEAFMWNGNYWANKPTDTNPNKCPWQDMGWEEDKSGLTGTAQVFTQHPTYIRRSFEIARSYTSAKLELRDYGIEFWDNSKKARGFYQLVKHLLNSGVPLDAVGFQGHFRTDYKYDWEKMKQAIKQYRDLGLEVYLTEVDYGDTDPVAAATSAHRTAAYDSIQAYNLHAFTKAAASAGASWICLWGIVDGLSEITAIRSTPLRNNEGFSYAKNGTLYIPNLSTASVRIVDANGAAQSTVLIRSGSGSIAHLSPGRFFWSLEGNESMCGTFLNQ